ncbi:MAG: hypothetical protein K8R36_15070 [Planctomycetales bacterium]|nr:hypothetical protein [Planctomycetales bacterium]
MRKWLKRLGILAGLCGVLWGAGLAYHKYHYPYGWSHCCDLQLGGALERYAELHDGWFPNGEKTPEASLSLLYRMDPDLWYLLPGKTVPESVVKSRLESGRLLSPETCGWHYVEGLHKDDDKQIAIAWDKVGLGHNGQRLPDGGHIVLTLFGNHNYIPGKEWGQFLADQAKLRAAVKRPPVVKPKISPPSK